MHKEHKTKLLKIKQKRLEQRKAATTQNQEIWVDILSRLDAIKEHVGESDTDKIVEQLKQIKPLDITGDIDSLKEAIKHSKVDTSTLEKLIKGLEIKPEIVNNVEIKSLDKLKAHLKSIEKHLKQNKAQSASDYTPMRRVVKVGNQFIFDDSVHDGGRGGGTSTQTLNDSNLAKEAKQNDIISDIRKRTTLFNSFDVSERTPIIELKSNYGVSALRDITSVSNSGAITNDSTEYNLSTGITTGSVATLRSAERGRYTPGAQGQAGIGVRLDETLTGTSEAKWGYFDDDNGFGFGVDASGTYVFIRRSGTDTKVHQADWNADTLDGNGDSGLTLDLAEGNIFQINFSWYGYGTIEFTVLMSDSNNLQSPVTIHRFSPSQQTSVADPNQPITATITNGNTTDDLDLFVGGRQFSIYNNFDPNRRINSQFRLSQSSIGTTFVPAISFRRKSAFETVSVKIAGYDIITDGALLVQLRVNAELTNASYTSPTNTSASETACEIDTSATAVSGGHLVYESLISVSGGGAFARGSGSASELYLDIPAVQPVTLCIRTISGSATASSILRWREEW